MIENVRPRVDHELKRLPVPFEVGNEHLHARLRGLETDLPDRLSPDPRSAVGQLVPIDAGDDGVAKAHLSDGETDAAWFAMIDGAGASGFDGAEAA